MMVALREFKNKDGIEEEMFFDKKNKTGANNKFQNSEDQKLGCKPSTRLDLAAEAKANNLKKVGVIPKYLDHKPSPESVVPQFDIISNEPSLFETFEQVKDLKGTGIGVGVDQMLDFFINSNLEKVILFDFDERVSLVSRALLEIGRLHHRFFKKFPTPQDFLFYLDDSEKGGLARALNFLSGVFSQTEMEILQEAFGRKERIFNPDRESVLHMYYRFKNEQTDYRSWMSDEEALVKTISAYEAGNIRIVNGNLAGNEELAALSDELKSNKQAVSLLYFSNAFSYLRTDEIEKASENISRLPISEKTVVISTSSFELSWESRELKPPEAPYPQKLKSLSYKSLAQLSGGWRYFVQSPTDWRQAVSSKHPFVFNHSSFDVEMAERLARMMKGDDSGVSQPKPGVYLAGL